MSPAWLLLAALLTPTASHTLAVRSSGAECVSQEVPRGAEVRFAFDVVRGGSFDVAMKITGPDHQVIYEVGQGVYRNETFTAYMKGIYVFCFQHPHESSPGTRIVDFSLHVGKPSEEQEEEGLNVTSSQSGPQVFSTETQIDPKSSAAQASPTDLMAVILQMEESVNIKIRFLTEQLSKLEKTVDKMKIAVQPYMAPT